jgi:hypothetical protein
MNIHVTRVVGRMKSSTIFIGLILLAWLCYYLVSTLSLQSVLSRNLSTPRPLTVEYQSREGVMDYSVYYVFRYSPSAPPQLLCDVRHQQCFSRRSFRQLPKGTTFFPALTAPSHWHMQELSNDGRFTCSFSGSRDQDTPPIPFAVLCLNDATREGQFWAYGT